MATLSQSGVAWRTRHDKTVPSSVVRADADIGARECRASEGFDRRALVEAELEVEAAAGAQVDRRLREEPAQVAKAVFVAVQRKGWLVEAHVRRQTAGLAWRDVGQVGDEDVDWLRQRVKQVALQQGDPGPHAEP